MHIEIHTDNHIQQHDALRTLVQTAIESSLERHRGKVTRVDVHLSDENGPKRGEDDIRCGIEVRMERMEPVVVSHKATEIESALSGATDKLERMLESKLGRMEANRST